MTNPQRKRLSASIRLNPLWKCISFTFHWLQSLWGDLLAARLKAPLNPHSARTGYRHQMKRSLFHDYTFLLNPAPVLSHGSNQDIAAHSLVSILSSFSFLIWGEALWVSGGKLGFSWWQSWSYACCTFRSRKHTSFWSYLSPRSSQSSSVPSNSTRFSPTLWKETKDPTNKATSDRKFTIKKSVANALEPIQ